MKKLLLVLMSVFFTLTACVEEISHPEVNYPEIHATIQNSQTKTVMDEHNNIRWSTGDQVVAFMKSSLGLKYQIKDAYVGKTSGYFSKVMTTPADEIGAGTALDHNIAYYPYSETVVVEKSLNIYILDVVLPDEQTYTAESFGNNSFPMVAVSEDNDFTFKNVCGGIKFQFKGDKKISSIKISGNNEEKLSGHADVYAYSDNADPTIEMSSSASTSVVLNCGDGIQLDEEIPTEFIISLPPVSFSKGFVVTITDTEGNIYELNSGKQNEVKRSSLLVMPPIDIQEKVVSTRMLKLVSVDYDSYQVEITVPETVGPDGNIVRYTFGDAAVFNDNINIKQLSYDLMLQWNGGERNTTDVNKVITIQATDEEEYYINPIAPGEPTVFIAGEYTRDGQLVGEPEIIRFKTKEPSVLNEEIDVEVSDISAIDATITIIPDDGIYQYCMLVLDEGTYNYLLQNIVSETDLQWFVSSYYAMYNYGAYPLTGSIETQLSNHFVVVPPADTKYHILITGMGNEYGTSQCFRHIEFRTNKKRLNPPSILVTPLPDKSTSTSAVFHIKCTSVDDPDAGMCVAGIFVANYDFYWGVMLNSGYSLEELVKEGNSFSAEELEMINSDEGYEMSVPACDGMTMRLGVLGYNEEHTPNDLNYDDIRQCPAIADIKTPFLVKPSVDSEFLTTDILEGDWIMTATDANGNPLETTVSIIRGYKAGRDYPADFSGNNEQEDETFEQFQEQVEIFNQKRLTDKNSLLLQGWFQDWRDENGPYALRTPYDLLMAQDYVAYNCEQLFYDAGPKLIIEVDSNGDLIARTEEESLSGCWWSGFNYQSYCSNLVWDQIPQNYLDFPIEISEDKKTMVIRPVDGDYYLNLVGIYQWGGVPSTIKSDIILKKK